MMFELALCAIESESDRAFMEEMYIANYALMYRKALSYLRNHHEAEDAVDAAMLKLIDRIDLLRGLNRGALRAYLLSCAKNAALNRLRAQDRLYNFDDAEAIACDRPVECEIDAGLLREAQVTAMRTVLERMPDRERELLRMKYYEQLDDSAIAEILCLRPNSVRGLVRRARLRAAKLYREVEGDVQ